VHLHVEKRLIGEGGGEGRRSGKAALCVDAVEREVPVVVSGVNSFLRGCRSGQCRGKRPVVSGLGIGNKALVFLPIYIRTTRGRDWNEYGEVEEAERKPHLPKSRLYQPIRPFESLSPFSRTLPTRQGKRPKRQLAELILATHKRQRYRPRTRSDVRFIDVKSRRGV